MDFEAVFLDLGLIIRTASVAFATTLYKALITDGGFGNFLRHSAWKLNKKILLVELGLQNFCLLSNGLKHKTLPC